IRADTQRKRGNDDCGEGWFLHQHPKAVAKILNQDFHDHISDCRLTIGDCRFLIAYCLPRLAEIRDAAMMATSSLASIGKESTVRAGSRLPSMINSIQNRSHPLPLLPLQFLR